MSRVLLASIALAALLAGIAWYVVSAEPPRTASTPAPLAAAAEPRAAAADLASVDASTPTTPDPVVLAAPDEGTRAAARSAGDEQLARAQWVEGRVVFPPGTPVDEEVFVIADGRDFADGGDHRARVEPDGRFRVAFSERSRTGVLRLEARYVFLEEPRPWTREHTEPIVLEPTLGGRVVARLLPPDGFTLAELDGSVRLGRHDRHNAGFAVSQRIAERELTAAGEIAFGGLTAELEHTLEYDGSRCLGDRVSARVVAGRTLQVDLPMRTGMVLTGRVLDERGAPLAGVRLEADTQSERRVNRAQRDRNGQSDADGQYRLGALEPEAVTLTVRHAGFEPVQETLEPPSSGATLVHDLVLRRGHSIAGSVRWPDGTPAEAVLYLTGLTGTGPRNDVQQVLVRAQADGSFEASGLTWNAYHVCATGKKLTEVPTVSAITGRERIRKERDLWSVEVERVDVGAVGVELVLGPGLSVRGVVREESGAPLDEFRITSRRISFPGNNWDNPNLPADRFSDAAGAFELAGFQPGTWVLRASAKDRVDSTPVEVQLPGAGPVELVVALEAIVRGTVLDGAGDPVAGANVHAVRPDAPHLPFDFLDAYTEDDTDAQGRFSIDGLRGGAVVLQVTSPTGAPGEALELELVGGQTVDGLVLRLSPGGDLEGEIVDGGGRPEQGLTVTLSSIGQKFHTEVATDAAGRFSDGDLPAGRLHVQCTNSDGIALLAEVEILPGQTARVRLAPPSTAPIRVFGRVLGAGEPIAGASVGAWREGADQSETGSRVEGLEETDASGGYELKIPGPGRWLVMVNGHSDGLGHWTSPLEVPDVAELRHDLVIALGRISGRVTDAQGHPVAGTYVMSEPQRHDGGTRGSSYAETDADGRYELVVPVGEHAVVADGGEGPGGPNWTAARVDGLRVTDGERRTGVDLVLHAGGTLSGVVRGPNGAPQPRATVFAGERSVGWTDAQGRFRTNGLAPGTHWVRAIDEGAATPSAVAVAIRVGEETQVELALVPGRMEIVRVVDAAGAPLGCEIEAVDADGRPVLVHGSGVQGFVHIGPLTPGRYRITVRREDKSIEQTLDVAGIAVESETVLTFP